MGSVPMRVGLLGVVLVAAVALRTLTGAMEQPRIAVVASVQTGGVAAFVPKAPALGEGWGMVGGGEPPADPAVFLESARAIYAGPLGAMVVLHVYRVVPGRAATVRAWEGVGAVFDDLRFGMGIYGQPQRVAVPPAPCVDATRIAGMDDTWNIPVGITLCALEPDVILLVAVGGMWRGMTGVGASDGVAQLVGRIGLGLVPAPPAAPVVASPIGTPMATPAGATPGVTPMATPIAEQMATPAAASTDVPKPADGQLAQDSETDPLFDALDGIEGGANRVYESATPGFFTVAAYSFFVLAFDSSDAAESAMTELVQRMRIPPIDSDETDFSTLRPVSFPAAKDGVVALGGEVDADGVSGNVAAIFVRDGRCVYGLFAAGLGADVFAEMDAFVEALPDDPETVGDDLFALLPELKDMPPGFLLESEEPLL